MSTGTLVDVVMPQMGVSVSEGTVVTWRKQVGETVKADETIVEISTDKVDTEVPAPATGTVHELLVPEGETVDVGTRIAVIDTGGGGGGAAAPAAPAGPAAAAPAAEAPAAAAAAPRRGARRRAARLGGRPALPGDAGRRRARRRRRARPTRTRTATGRDLRSFMSPVVARMVAEHGLDISQIAGSGRGGRVTKKDVEEHLAGGRRPPRARGARAAPAAAARGGRRLRQPAVQAPTGADADGARAQRPPATRSSSRCRTIRKMIARNLRKSVDTAVHVSTFFEVDMTRCWAVRSAVNKELTKTYGVKASFLPFIMRATVEAIQHWPVGQRRAARHRHRRQAPRQPRRRRLGQRRQGPRRARSSTTPRSSTCSA